MTKKLEATKERLVDELGQIDTAQTVSRILRLFRNDPDHPPNAGEVRKHWYYCSYPLFIDNAERIKQSFQNREVTHDATFFEKEVTQMVAFVMSWIGHIPTARIKNPENLEKLRRYIKGFASEGISLSTHRQIPLEEKKIEFKEAVKGYCESVNILIYGQRKTLTKRANIPTVSKFLHFLHPDLFPILDKKLNNSVFQRFSEPNMKTYINYIEALKCALEDNEIAQKITELQESLAEGGMKVSKVRAIDMALF